jgi:hypothetical protein
MATGPSSAHLSRIAVARSLQLLQSRVHLLEQVVVRLSNGALRDQALQSGFLLLDAQLTVVHLSFGDPLIRRPWGWHAAS